jgi:hypothetical protein
VPESSDVSAASSPVSSIAESIRITSSSDDDGSPEQAARTNNALARPLKRRRRRESEESECNMDGPIRDGGYDRTRAVCAEPAVSRKGESSLQARRTRRVPVSFLRKNRECWAHSSLSVVSLICVVPKGYVAWPTQSRRLRLASAAGAIAAPSMPSVQIEKPPPSSSSDCSNPTTRRPEPRLSRSLRRGELERSRRSSGRQRESGEGFRVALCRARTVGVCYRRECL